MFVPCIHIMSVVCVLLWSHMHKCMRGNDGAVWVTFRHNHIHT